LIGTRTGGAYDMSTVYEYWQHRATGAVWAVKLRDGKVIGAACQRSSNNPHLWSLKIPHPS